MKIEIEPQPRPCIAHPGRKALFHRFVEVAEVLAPSIMTGGHSGGQLKNTYALLEYEDGTLSMEPINRIILLDSDELFCTYNWEALGAAAKAKEMADAKAKEMAELKETRPIPRKRR